MRAVFVHFLGLLLAWTLCTLSDELAPLTRTLSSLYSLYFLTLAATCLVTRSTGIDARASCNLGVAEMDRPCPGQSQAQPSGVVRREHHRCKGSPDPSSTSAPEKTMRRVKRHRDCEYDAMHEHESCSCRSSCRSSSELLPRITRRAHLSPQHSQHSGRPLPVSAEYLCCILLDAV